MRDASTGKVVVARAVEAESMRDGLVGLLGRSGLDAAEALWLRANGVHTFGMRFAIDVVVLDSAGQVLRIADGVSPNRIVWPVRGGRFTLEMAAGSARSSGIAVGDRLLRVASP